MQPKEHDRIGQQIISTTDACFSRIAWSINARDLTTNYKWNVAYMDTEFKVLRYDHTNIVVLLYVLEWLCVCIWHILSNSRKKEVGRGLRGRGGPN